MERTKSLRPHVQGREDKQGRAMRATLLLRRAHALMNMARWDEARMALDEALHDAKASEDGGVVAQAFLGAGGDASNTPAPRKDRKGTRLNSRHRPNSYAA